MENAGSPKMVQYPLFSELSDDCLLVLDGLFASLLRLNSTLRGDHFQQTFPWNGVWLIVFLLEL